MWAWFKKKYLETRERNLELFSLFDSDPNIHVLSVLELFSIFDSDPNIHVLSVLCWRAVSQLPSGQGLLLCTPAVTPRQISDPCIGIGNLPLQISDPCRRYLRIGSFTPRRECSITPRPVQLRVQHNTPAGAVSCSLTRCCTWISLQKIDSMLHTEAAAGAFSYLVLDSSARQLYS